MADAIASRGHNVAIPFRVGWGFQLDQKALSEVADILSQSLSGWGGVFNAVPKASYRLPYWTVAIPFRVGWGFQPIKGRVKEYNGELSQSLSGWGFQPQQWGALKLERKKSQSLSGWGGVFNWTLVLKYRSFFKKSQSLSGWGGVLNANSWSSLRLERKVAIPFRVGWGFQRLTLRGEGRRYICRNPFQGGVGFSTGNGFWSSQGEILMSQSLSGWGGVFNPKDLFSLKLEQKSQSLSGWGGVFNGEMAKIFYGRDDSRNPFQGGVGFSTAVLDGVGKSFAVAIPFRVGWGFQLPNT